MSTIAPQVPRQTLGEITEQLLQKQQTCTICDIFFKKSQHYHRHIRQKHSEERNYICKQDGCQKSFKRGSHLKRHMISHTNFKNYKCIQCIMSFGYKHHLDRHIKLIHLSERLQCSLCNELFKKKKSLSKHMAKAHKQHMKKLNLNQDSKPQDNCTITKIGLQESINHDIYDSDQEPEKGDKLLYRCIHENCLSAFQGLYQFKRHLSKVHSQNKINE